ncbi:metallophosphoesterase [Rhizobium sp. CG5]|uniref:metallophosphoesterase family protein n=1 Tax=Rhizobium sp. CG5 TaxID=2726076 RepID=UPI002033322B|nr:metallophosphoesterase [Rhizobium sp. CG5]MCM2475449.1 metallophosphoesterase [Rhizobium sp. CG5]
MAHDPDRRFSLAVIADAHFHDIEGDYAVPSIAVGERRLTLQTWAHSRESTRVFNESAGAFDRALETIAARGIRHVVLLGDYTDDGQRRTTASLERRLADHEAQFGTRFYALPGNHDMFGPWGRHQSRYFLQEDGVPVLVTSDGRDPKPGSIVTPHMYCEGYPAALLSMARHGYFRRPVDWWWETPFGHDDALEARRYEVVSQDGQNRHLLVDASYLVEPEEGLWLLMIDANVFEPNNGTFKTGSKGAFIDSTGAGWNAMLRLKPFIFDWIRDVSARATALGKVLLTYSHYPAISPFGDGGDGFERDLFPGGVAAQRIPQDAVAEALITAGISLHFSGHWHVRGVSRRKNANGELTNISVPSLVAFPPAFDVVSVCHDDIAVETVDISSMALDQAIVALYRRECEQAGLSEDAALSAATYGEFLSRHTKALVLHRYFPREWPAQVVAAIISMTVADLLRDPVTRPRDGADFYETVAMSEDELKAIDVIGLVTDWYLIRQGGSIAMSYLGNRRIAVLRGISLLYCEKIDDEDNRAVARYLATFFRSLIFYLDRAAGPTAGG